jgi:L-serine dehydratase
MENVNIASMKVYRNSRGLEATMAIETDNIIPGHIVNVIEKIPEIKNMKIINPIVEGEI